MASRVLARAPVLGSARNFSTCGNALVEISPLAIAAGTAVWQNSAVNPEVLQPYSLTQRDDAILQLRFAKKFDLIPTNLREIAWFLVPSTLTTTRKIHAMRNFGDKGDFLVTNLQLLLRFFEIIAACVIPMGVCLIVWCGICVHEFNCICVIFSYRFAWSKSPRFDRSTL